MKAVNLRLNLNDLELKKLLEKYRFNVQNDYEIAVRIKNKLMTVMCVELYYEEYNKSQGNMSNLRLDREYVVGALTLGVEVDEISEQLKRQELFLGVYILECLCNELLNKAYQQFSSYLRLESGKGLSRILFPGEDLPIEHVGDILGILDIGQISVNKYYILTPSKSVVFMGEISKDDQPSVIKNCETCNNLQCAMRIGKRKELSIASQKEQGDNLGVAIDIGTTTVEILLINLRTGEELGRIKEYNAQRVYGFDVITRSEKALSNKEIAKKCQKIILKQLTRMIDDLTDKLGTTIDLIQIAAIAGNTIMIHMLMNYDLSGLVKYPFIPVTTEKQILPGSSIGLECPVSILPGISAYVGADALGGAVACGLNNASELQLFVDLGTNAEMMLSHETVLLCASTAMGPTFEGANISCGMSALDGAITGFDGRSYTILGKQKPRGLCASGLIDVLAFLRKEKLMDETGRLAEHLNGKYQMIAGLSITQDDIRHLQVAISAVRTGIEILMEHYHVSTVSNIILTGGFAKYANATNMVKIGLLPNDCEKKITLVENTSLQAAKKACLDKKFIDDCETLKKKARHVELANMPEFNRLFIENMHF